MSQPLAQAGVVLRISGLSPDHRSVWLVLPHRCVWGEVQSGTSGAALKQAIEEKLGVPADRCVSGRARAWSCFGRAL